jgi:hypothetical protein
MDPLGRLRTALTAARELAAINNLPRNWATRFLFSTRWPHARQIRYSPRLDATHCKDCHACSGSRRRRRNGLTRVPSQCCVLRSRGRVNAASAALAIVGICRARTGPRRLAAWLEEWPRGRTGMLDFAAVARDSEKSPPPGLFWSNLPFVRRRTAPRTPARGDSALE